MSIKRSAVLLPLFLLLTVFFACEKFSGGTPVTGVIELTSTHPSPFSLPENLRESYVAVVVVQSDGKQAMISCGDPDSSYLKSQKGKTVTLTGKFEKKTQVGTREYDLYTLKKIKDVK